MVSGRLVAFEQRGLDAHCILGTALSFLDSFLPRRPTNLGNIGQRPIALAVSAGSGCLDIFSPVYLFSFLSFSLTVRRPDIVGNIVSKGR